MTWNDELVPLLELPTSWKDIEEDLSKKIVDVMTTSGFLLVKSSFLSYEFQKDVLDTTKQFLSSKQNNNENDTHNLVVQHPHDPKIYAMLSHPFISSSSNILPSIFMDYHDKMEQLKMILLHLLDIGLQQKQQKQKSLVSLHSQKNNTLRLLYYPPITNDDNDDDDGGGGGNRCKEHSDYGSITLLLIDGVSGLEFYHDETNSWMPVPYIPGSIIVNIGTWLSETYHKNSQQQQQQLKATLHRVAGPKSLNSSTPLDVLQNASKQGRTSIAFFADPNANEPIEITKSNDNDQQQQQTIAEYIQWRSGGSDSNRTGVAYTINEQSRIHKSSSKKE